MEGGDAKWVNSCSAMGTQRHNVLRFNDCVSYSALSLSLILSSLISLGPVVSPRLNSFSNLSNFDMSDMAAKMARRRSVMFTHLIAVCRKFFFPYVLNYLVITCDFILFLFNFIFIYFYF